jgi:hypothetical protein
MALQAGILQYQICKQNTQRLQKEKRHFARSSPIETANTLELEIKLSNLQVSLKLLQMTVFSAE